MTHMKIVRPITVAAALLTALAGGTATWLAMANTDGAPQTVRLNAPGAASSIVVDERAGHALVVGDGPHSVLTILDTRDGRVLGAVPLPGHYVGDAAAVAARFGHLFVPNTVSSYNNSGSSVDMLDTRTGAFLRAIAVPVGPATVVADDRSGHVFVASTGAMNPKGGVGGGVVVSMLDARDGATLRHTTVPLVAGTAAMAVDGMTGRVFVVGYAGNAVVMLDTHTGRLLRVVPVGMQPCCVVADEATGRVFVANEGSNTVSVLDARTGAVLTTSPAGFAAGLAVNPRAGRVVVANGSMTVTLLDARSGAVLRAVTVGGGPTAVSVDARTGRAVVTGTGNSVSILLHRLGHGQLAQFGEWRGDYVTVLDTRSGAILRRAHTSSTDRIAVDQWTGHVFIADYQGNSVHMLDVTR